VQTCLSHVADLTGVPVGKLRPTDRFDTGLAPPRGWEFDDGLGLLPDALQETFGVDAENFDLGQNPTIGDLLSAVARARRTANGNG